MPTPCPLARSTLPQAGTPLCDEDRWPWLQQLAGIVQQHLAAGQPAVLSCSALQPAYRHLLRTGSRQGAPGETDGDSSSAQAGTAAAGAPGSSSVAFVLLEPPRAELEQRLLRRTAAGGHFTPGAALLDSQLAALRYDESELLLRVAGHPFPAPEQIVEAILQLPGAAARSADDTM